MKLRHNNVLTEFRGADDPWAHVKKPDSDVRRRARQRRTRQDMTATRTLKHVSFLGGIDDRQRQPK